MQDILEDERYVEFQDKLFDAIEEIYFVNEPEDLANAAKGILIFAVTFAYGLEFQPYQIKQIADDAIDFYDATMEEKEEVF